MKWFKSLCNILKKTDKENSEDDAKKLKFKKLTPTKLKKMDYYEEALDFAFKESDLLNIAITGAYGAGKSSVIKTYENLNKDKKFIYISLANFEQIHNKSYEEDKANEGKNKEKKNGNELEGKILNQLIHQIDPKRIPQTRFKVKSKVTKGKVIRNTILTTVFIILILYNIRFSDWKMIVGGLSRSFFTNFLHFTISNESLVLSNVICIGIFGFYIYRIIKIQMEREIFKKVKWQNNEIEIFEEKDDSYFNKYLDEILYLFHGAKVDAVVFEDIDRYNNNIIFKKLREINFLINNSANKDMKPIKFFYLIRDDMFTSKDRTKFFDFIIPIVPFIDGSNSYDMILKYFEKGGILECFEKSFLERVSLYIDDMRILKNIYNEYIIYNGRIQKTELDSNKLLAVIIYKNIFPNDFIKLQLGFGYINTLLNKKDVYIGSMKNEIDEKTNKNLSRIEIMKKEQLNDLDELDTLYLTFGQYNYEVDGKLDDKFNSRVAYIRELKKPDSKIQRYGVYYSDRKDIEKELTEMRKNPEYVERKNIIEEKMNNGIEKLEEENMRLKREKNKLDSLKLYELIKKYKLESAFLDSDLYEKDESFEFHDIVESQYYDLVKFLIRNGYIDETYPDYLTYFHENSMTRRDKIFLRSVTDKKAKEFTYKLDDVERIIQFLRASDFEEEETLNFDLLEYLLEHEHEYLKVLLEQLKDQERFDFVWGYLVQASNKDKFVKKLNITWYDLWLYLIFNDEVAEKQRKTYMIYTLYYSAEEEIKSMNIDNCMTSYISNKNDFLNIDEPRIELLIDKLLALNVKFKYINYNKCDKRLFNEVYKHNLYLLNFDMIRLILEKRYNFSYSDDFKRKNYTLISSKPDEPLKHYIENNMNEYMKVILNNLDGEINDTEENVLEILNNEDIELNHKLLYIQNLSTSISHLSDTNDELWEELLKNNIIEYSTENVLEYYFNYSGSMDDILVNYLNDNSKEIIFNSEDMETEFEGQDTSNFFVDVINEKDLNNEKYEMILKGYNYSINNFQFNDIEDEKFKILVKLDIIGTTKKNIEFIRENYPNQAMFFICNNIEEYIECLDEEILNEDEILNLLGESNISDEHKISLIEKYPSSISLKENNFSEKVQLFIIKSNFEEEDLFYLVENYDKGSSEMKKMIESLSITHVEKISNTQCLLSYNLLFEIMSNTEVDEYYKKVILYNNLDELNVDEIIECMSSANFDKFVKLFNGKNPKILITDENRNILNYFKEKGWISSFKQDPKFSGYYRAYGRDYSKRRKKALST